MELTNKRRAFQNKFSHKKSIDIFINFFMLENNFLMTTLDS